MILSKIGIEIRAVELKVKCSNINDISNAILEYMKIIIKDEESNIRF
jgi:hypothetical protein